jgi:hypothetical protein
MTIKVMQEWKSTAFVAPHVHNWEMFIKPKELFEIFYKNDLLNEEVKGISPSYNFISHYLNLRRAVKRKISYSQLAKKMKFHLNNNKTNSYIGYAVKTVHGSL